MFKRLTTQRGVLTAALAVACLAGIPRAHADAKGTEALERQVQELSRQVGNLVQRVHVLEDNLAKLKAAKSPQAQPAAPAVQPAAPAPATAQAPPKPEPATAQVPAPQPAAQAPAAAPLGTPQPPTLGDVWKKVKEGMTADDVTRLLGAPSAKFKVGGQTVWYYTYRGVGSGSIAFYDDGHVANKQNPPGVTIWHW